MTQHAIDNASAFGDDAIRERRTITSGSSLATVIDTTVDDAHSTKRPDGSNITVLSTAADPRWGAAALFASSVQTDVGSVPHRMTRNEARTVTLATPNDLFSVAGLTVTTTRSGSGGVPPSSTTTRTFSAGPPAKWTTTSAANVVVEETLDSQERVTQTAVLGSSPVTLNPVQYHYDNLGRVDQVTWGTRVYGTTYNATTGWPDSTSAPAGLGVTYSTRDADGRPTLMMLAGSRALAMSYDLTGNVVSVTPPSKPAHGFSFDPNDRLASYVPPDLSPALSPKDTPYAWDGDGLLLLAQNPGKTVGYTYDALGRLARRVDAVTTTQTFDSAGRLSTVVTSDGVTLTNTWDGSLLTKQATTGPFTRALNKTYDNFLRVSSWDLDGLSPISVTYDGDDRITAAGGMSVTRGTNGLLTGTTVGSVSDSFGFNAYGEVTSHGVTGSAIAFSATTTRDAAGRIDLRTEAIGGVTHSYQYAYDTAGRLASVKVDGASTPTRSWTYDPNGNRDGATYDAQDRLTAFAGATYTYGNNGELATKTDATGVTTYGYDANGNLRSVARPSPLTAVAYVIDGQNRRIGKKLGSNLVQGFVYEGSRIVAELGSTGAEVARFVYATGSHSPDLVIKAGVTYRIVKDHLGSPRIVVNTASGAVAQRLDYDEWGNTTIVTDSSPAIQPFGFAGGLWDHDTNLVRFGARDYDPTTGRWTTKDAIRFEGGDTNIYAYVTNDPANVIDPSGLRTECSSDGFGNCGAGPYPGPDGPRKPATFCEAFPQLCGGDPGGGGGQGGAGPGISPPGGRGQPANDCSKPDKKFCDELQDEAQKGCVDEIFINNPTPRADNVSRLRICIRKVMHRFGCSY